MVCLVPCSQQNLEMERKLKSQVPSEGVGVAGGMDEVHIHCSVSCILCSSVNLCETGQVLCSSSLTEQC